MYFRNVSSTPFLDESLRLNALQYKDLRCPGGLSSFRHPGYLLLDPVNGWKRGYRSTLLEIMMKVYDIYVSNYKDYYFSTTFRQSFVNFCQYFHDKSLPMDGGNICFTKLSLFCLSAPNRWPFYRRIP